MYYVPCMYSAPYCQNLRLCHCVRPSINSGPPYYSEYHQYSSPINPDYRAQSKDYGKKPYVININDAATKNNTFRTVLWTGDHLQVTVMSIGVGEDVGLEVHPTTDQFLRIEEGHGVVQMGNTKDDLSFERNVYDDYAIMVPAGMWHNLTNTGDKPLKLYSIYAPPEHPFGTVHKTMSDDLAAEDNYN